MRYGPQRHSRGSGGGNVSDSNTYSWDGTQWTALPSGATSACGTMVSDRAGDRVLIPGDPVSVWNGSSWGSITPAQGADYSCAWETWDDTLSEGIGYDDAGGMALWSQDGCTYQPVAAPTGLVGLTSNPISKAVVAVSSDGATWQRDGTGHWARKATMGFPTSTGPIVFDPATSKVMTLALAANAGADTYEWDGTSWSEMVGVHAQGPSGNSLELVNDDGRKRVIAITDIATWEWSGTAWSGAVDTPFTSSAALFDSSQNRVVGFDSGPTSGGPPAQWTWSGTAWSRLGETLGSFTLQNYNTAPTFGFDKAIGRAVAGDGTALVTWELNGLVWISAGASVPSDLTTATGLATSTTRRAASSSTHAMITSGSTTGTVMHAVPDVFPGGRVHRQRLLRLGGDDGHEMRRAVPGVQRGGIGRDVLTGACRSARPRSLHTFEPGLRRGSGRRRGVLRLRPRGHVQRRQRLRRSPLRRRSVLPRERMPGMPDLRQSGGPRPMLGHHQPGGDRLLWNGDVRRQRPLHGEGRAAVPDRI